MSESSSLSIRCLLTSSAAKPFFSPAQQTKKAVKMDQRYFKSYQESKETAAGFSIEEEKLSNCDGDTDLHTAIREKNDIKIKKLLKSDVKFINHKNISGLTAFNLATLVYPECLCYFLNTCPDVDVENPFPTTGSNALIELIKSGKNFAVYWLLRFNKSDLNKTIPSTGETPLIFALTKCNEVITKMLIDIPELKVNLHSYKNAKDTSEDKVFPSLIAVRHSFTRGLELLLSRPDFNINEKTHKYGYSVLFYAIKEKKLDTINLLFKLKAEKKIDLDVNIQTKNGYTPLYIAISRGLENVVEKLLSFPDIKPNLALKRHLTQICAAIQLQYSDKYSEKSYDIVKILLNSGKVDFFPVLETVNKSSDDKMKEIFKNCLEIKPSIFSETDKVTKLIEKPISAEYLKKTEKYNLLSQIIEIIPGVEFITINMSEFYNEEDMPKMSLFLFSKNSIIIEIFNADYFEKYIQQEKRHPITKMPVFSYFDFTLEKFKENAYILPASQFLSIMQLIPKQLEHKS